MVQTRSATEREILQAAYETFKALLRQENEKAKKSGKPFLILIGETHYDPYCTLIETMILYIAYSSLDIKNTMVESDIFRYNNFKKTDPSSFPWQALERLTAKKNGRFHLIDDLSKMTSILEDVFISFISRINRSLNWGWLSKIIARLELNNEIDKQVEPMVTPMQWREFLHQDTKVRNRFMAHKLREINQGGIAVVGANHLYGLLNETYLDNFHVLTLNSVRSSTFDISQDFAYAKNSKDIYQAEEFLSSAKNEFLLTKFEKNMRLLKQIDMSQETVPAHKTDKREALSFRRKIS